MAAADSVGVRLESGRVDVPLGTDLRPWQRSSAQALGLVAAVSGVVLLASNGTHGYFFGLGLGLFLTTAVGSIAQVRALRFRTRHQDEDIEFWRTHYGKVRPWAFFSAVALLALGVLVMGLGVAMATGWLIGLPQFPCLGAATVIIALHGRLHP